MDKKSLRCSKVIYHVQCTVEGRNWNEKYPGMLALVDGDDTLSLAEKDMVKQALTKIKDKENLLFYKEQKYKCDVCKREGYTIFWCQNCVTDFLLNEATKWTTGNDYVNWAILRTQIRAPLPEIIPEWFPYELFKGRRCIAEGGCTTIYGAYLTRGTYSDCWNKETKSLSRYKGIKTFVLKQL